MYVLLVILSMALKQPRIAALVSAEGAKITCPTEDIPMSY